MTEKIKDIKNKEISKKLEFVFIWIFIFYLGIGMITVILMIFNPDCADDIKELSKNLPDVITALFPTILTVISIIFSINDNNIYGVSINTFRKMRGENYYTFSEMVYFTLYAYVLYAIAKVSGLVFCGYFIDFVIILYSLIFIHQDLPLIEKDKDTILKSIKDIFHSNSNNILIGRNNENHYKVELITLLKNLLNSLDFCKTFEILEVEDKNTNSNIVYTLLSLDKEDIDSLIKRCNKNEIIRSLVLPQELEDRITTFYNNVNFILENSYNLDLSKHEENKDVAIYYVIANFIISINLFSDSIFKGLNYGSVYRNAINTFTIILNPPNLDENFSLRLLNLIMIKALQNHDNLFIREYFKASTELYYKNEITSKFIMHSSIYLYYQYKNFNKFGMNNNIASFINNKQLINKDRTDIKSWKEQVEMILRTPCYFNICNYITDFIKIYNFEFNSRIQENLYEFIINCWIEMILAKYYEFVFKEKKFKELLESLDDNTKFSLSKILNINWFDENDEFKINNNLEYVDFYGISNHEVYKEKNDPLVESLKNFKNDYLFEYYKNRFVSDDTLNFIKNGIIKGFNKMKTSMTYIDESIECDNSFDVSTKKALILDENHSYYFIDKAIRVIEDSIRDKIQNVKCFNIIIDDKDFFIRKLSQEEIDSLLAEHITSNSNVYKFNQLDLFRKVYLDENKMKEIINGFYINVDIKIKYGIKL